MSLSSVFDPVDYPFWAINYFLALWFMAHVVYFAFGSCSINFDSLSEEKRRNVVSYVLELVVSPFALFAELYGGRNVLFRPNNEVSATFESEIKWMTGALIMIGVLYVWELIYRLRFGIPLLVHHVLTLFFIQLVTITFQQEHLILYMRIALALGFYATTEQLSFVALLCFRLNIGSLKLQKMLFLLSAIQTIIVKSAITLGAAVYYFKILMDHPSVVEESVAAKRTSWGTYWKITFLPLLVGLFCSQLYAGKILYLLSQREGATKKPESHVANWNRHGGSDAESLTPDVKKDHLEQNESKQDSKEQCQKRRSTGLTDDDDGLVLESNA